MLSVLDIWRAAKLLIFHHGDAAPIQAEMRADEMLDAGNMDEKRVWLRTKAATEQLLRETPKRPLH